MSKLSVGPYPYTVLLGESVYERLHKGIFAIECSRLQLFREVGGQEYIAEGPGRIWNESDGQLFFEIFVQWETDSDFRIWSSNKQYYSDRLIAVDRSDRMWLSENVYEGFGQTSVHGPGTRFSILRGMIPNMIQKSDIIPSKSGPDWMQLILRFDGILPFNEVVNVDQTVLGKSTRIHSGRDVLDFTCKDFRFTFLYEKLPKRLTITVTTENYISIDGDGMENKLTQCLQFICGRLMPYYIKVTRKSDEYSTTLSSVESKRENLRILSPVSEIGDHSNFVTLFTRYWQLVEDIRNDDLHSVTVWTRHLLFAQGSLLETQVLEACAAIDGLVTHLIKETDLVVSMPSDSQEIEIFWKDIKSDLKLIIKKKRKDSAWSTNQAAKLDRLQSMLFDSLSRLNQPTTKTVLQYLVQHGVLAEEQLNYWDKYRNPLAHGTSFPLAFEDLPIANRKLLTAYYRIVFFLIDFRGEYIDHGTPDSIPTKFTPAISAPIRREYS